MTDGNIIPTGPTTSHESDDHELLHTVYTRRCHSGAFAWAGELLEQAYMLA